MRAGRRGNDSRPEALEAMTCGGRTRLPRALEIARHCLAEPDERRVPRDRPHPARPSGTLTGITPSPALARLIAARFGAADLRPAGAGGDHVAWRVEAADGLWVVRTPRSGGEAGTEGPSPAEAARREVAVTDLVRRRVGRWAPEAEVLDGDAGVVASRWVPGTPLQDLVAAGVVGPTDRARLAAEIGEFVRDVAALDPGEAGAIVDATPLAEWRDDCADMLASVARVVGADRRERVEAFLAADLPPDVAPTGRRLAHADLGAEHVIVDDQLVVTGVIDWSDSGVTDPASDLGRVLRDLGEDAFRRALEAVAAAGVDAGAGESSEARAARARVYARCLAVEDLAYALEHRPDLVPHDLRVLDRLFPQPR
ncbi:MAG TPA: aminoglycoside phosphotransferase family protein [Acidimicrobiales bacterium]|nr:aminoglycoside phosphotransferase family protein [Acidimicrobiales bacterium]